MKVTYVREGKYIQKIKWTVPKPLMKNKTPEDIMMEHGFHPAGYGTAFDKTEDENNIYFFCSGSCD